MQDTLQAGLEERGFPVMRLNAYDTVTPVWSEQDRDTAATCSIVCFASPLAVKGWMKNLESIVSVLVACIGERRARACRKQGWKEDAIFYPNKLGLEGWLQVVEDALESLQQQ